MCMCVLSACACVWVRIMCKHFMVLMDRQIVCVLATLIETRQYLLHASLDMPVWWWHTYSREIIKVKKCDEFGFGELIRDSQTET